VKALGKTSCGKSGHAALPADRTIGVRRAYPRETAFTSQRVGAVARRFLYPPMCIVAAEAARDTAVLVHAGARHG